MSELPSVSRILVVDDHPLNRRLLEVWLGKQGFAVSGVNNGLEAVDRVTGYPGTVDLVLMDCRMPVMDGLEATRRLRQWEAENNGPRLPIVAVTTGGDGISRTVCLEAGMDDFLMKPVSFSLLDDTIRRLLKR
jgi:CheY-like chemotaxis protein